jgi:hypothetical protein
MKGKIYSDEVVDSKLTFSLFFIAPLLNSMLSFKKHCELGNMTFTDSNKNSSFGNPFPSCSPSTVVAWPIGEISFRFIVFIEIKFSAAAKTANFGISSLTDSPHVERVCLPATIYALLPAV